MTVNIRHAINCTEGPPWPLGMQQLKKAVKEAWEEAEGVKDKNQEQMSSHLLEPE